MSSAGAAIAFATVTMTFLTAALYALPAFGSTIQDDMSLSDTQLGLLSSAFVISYAAVQIPTGIASGVFGLRAMFVASYAICGAAFVGSGLVHSFGVLIVLRAVCGAGAGMMFPVASALARTAAPGENPRSQGIFGSGWGLGFVVGLLVLPLVFGSWRAAFVVVGAIGLALAAFAAFLVPRRPLERPISLADARSGIAQWGTWLLGGCFMGITIANVGVGSWATSYLEDHRGVGDSTTALISSLIGWGLLPATIAGVLLARRLGGLNVVRLACGVLAASLVVVALPVPLALFALGLLLLGFGSGLPFGILLSLVPRVVRGPGGEAQAAVVGAINTTAFVGGVIAPTMIGAIRDGGGGFGLGFTALLLGPAITLLCVGRIAAILRAGPTSTAEAVTRPG